MAYRIQESAVGLIIVLLLQKGYKSGLVKEETHRVRSGTVSKKNILCPLPLEAGGDCMSCLRVSVEQYVQSYTNQPGSPLFSARFLTGNSPYRHD